MRGRGVFFLVLTLLTVVGGSVAAFRTGAPPDITISSSLPAIGRKTLLMIDVTEPRRGLGTIKVEVLQKGHTRVLAERRFTPLPSWKFWGPRAEKEEMSLGVGSENVPGLEEGSLTIRVTASRAPSWLRSPAAVVREASFPVRLRPPSLEVLSTATYVHQGGAEAVVYRVGESTVKDGVRAGGLFFPGFSLPGGGRQDRFALFAVPYDLSDASGVRLTAADDIGNENVVSFINKFFRRPFKTDTIELSDPFLQKVVPAILAQTPEVKDQGGPLENYLLINRVVRDANAKTLHDLAAGSKPEFLWSRPFAPLRNGKVMSSFADRRTYLYKGRVVDHQDHLGFDLAGTRAMPVPAANDGRVALARFLGIYGNAVVIDHGYGLMSLYGHLSAIQVSEGQAVKLGDIIGRSGDTGLAGGDHLHFSVLLQGLPVTPKEWWDPHWIQDRLARKLGAALPYKGE